MSDKKQPPRDVPKEAVDQLAEFDPDLLPTTTEELTIPVAAMQLECVNHVLASLEKAQAVGGTLAEVIEGIESRFMEFFERGSKPTPNFEVHRAVVWTLGGWIGQIRVFDEEGKNIAEVIDIVKGVGQGTLPSKVSEG